MAASFSRATAGPRLSFFSLVTAVFAPTSKRAVVSQVVRNTGLIAVVFVERAAQDLSMFTLRSAVSEANARGSWAWVSSGAGQVISGLTPSNSRPVGTRNFSLSAVALISLLATLVLLPVVVGHFNSGSGSDVGAPGWICGTFLVSLGILTRRPGLWISPEVSCTMA